MWSSIQVPFLALLSAIALSACGQKAPAPDPRPPVVRVASLEPVAVDTWTLTGRVHAQIESILGFRVAGQIVRRDVSAGDRVEAGQPLMGLDGKDLEQKVAAAEAQLNSARAEADNAVAERERSSRLLARKLISPQAFDNARTLADAALQRVAVAEAELRQARNAKDYAELKAPAAGVLLNILAEPGQVVGAGQAVATLAQNGPREVEVFISEKRLAKLPKKARVITGEGQMHRKATLRELAAEADPETRTWRARYQLQMDNPPPLGSIVRLAFSQSEEGAVTQPVYRVPLGALSERGEGAHLWRVVDGRVSPEPVEILRLDREEAYVASRLPAGSLVVALGTHLLTDGQVVEVARP